MNVLRARLGASAAVLVVLFSGLGCSSSTSEMQCVRAIRCVARCGGPVLQEGCAACPSGSFDDITCTVADAGPSDARAPDASAADASREDAAEVHPDATPSDAAGFPDAAPMGTDASVGDGGGTCQTDQVCTRGQEWCVGGACVPCDNSGQVCRITCPFGWTLYQRNGCSPCECAPDNACTSDVDCAASGGHCYPGAFCWDWCPAGDPSCCFGNFCSASGCADPAPVGCVVRGCPAGQQCVTMNTCGSSGCSCMPGGQWACTPDCGGGECR